MAKEKITQCHLQIYLSLLILSLSLSLYLQHVVIGESQLWIPDRVKNSLRGEVDDSLAHEAGVRRVLCLLAKNHNILLITSKPTAQQMKQYNLLLG